MKNIHTWRFSLLATFFLAYGILLPNVAFSATTPSLGQTALYQILSSTYTNTTVTTINGGIGFTTPPAVVPLGIHANYGSGSPYATAGVDQGAMLSALNLEPCTYTFPIGAIDLSTDITHGVLGVYTPGVYCSTGAMNIGAALTLQGSGTYIFRPVGALTSTAGSNITLTGALACDVFWTPTQAATLAANSSFIGTIIADAGITVGANVTWIGSALAFGGTVTTDTTTMSAPACTPPVPPVVTQSSGGVYSMPWSIPRINVTKVATPSALPTGPGTVTYDYVVSNPGDIAMSVITVTDDRCAPMQYIAGDINNDLKMSTVEAWTYRCTTNLTQTTTNVVTATGYADFSTARDTAEATVVVWTPLPAPFPTATSTPVVIVAPESSSTPQVGFPNAGLHPYESNNRFNVYAIVLFLVICTLLITNRKRLSR